MAGEEKRNALKFVASIIIGYAGFGASFLVNGYLAQHLDLDGLGDFHVALSVASIAAALVIFGGQAAARRFIPQYFSQDQWGEAKGFIDHYLKLALKLGGAAIVVSLLAAGAFTFFELEALLHETLLAIVVTPLIAISLFIGATIQSLHRPIAAILPHELLKPTLFWLGCLLWLQFFSTFNEFEAIGILVVVSSIQLTVQLYLLKGALPFSWRETQPVYDSATWHKVSVPLLYARGCFPCANKRVGARGAARRGARSWRLLVADLHPLPRLDEFQFREECDRAQNFGA